MVYLIFMPVNISIFASPISASNINTLYPSRLRDMAKLTAKLDFPTPPFPLVIANTLALFRDNLMFFLNSIFHDISQFSA